MSINLGVAVPLKDYDSIHRILNSIKTQYNIHSGKSCSKGKALVEVIKHGFTAYINALEKASEAKKEKLKQLKEVPQ